MSERFGQDYEPAERRVARLVGEYADAAVRPFDAAAIAHGIATGNPRRYGSRRGGALGGLLAGDARSLRLAFLMLVLVALSMFAVAVIVSQRARHLADGPVRNGLIAFDAAGDILVAEADGTRPRVLVGGPTLDWRPTFSSDGTRLAYWSARLSPAQQGCRVPLDEPARYTSQPPQTLCDVDADLTVRDLATGQTIAVATGIPTPGVISWSPGGDQIAYGSGAGIGVTASDRPGRATLLVPGVDAAGPAWSPDGTRIAYRFRDERGPGVWVVAPDGTGPHRVTTAAGTNGGMAFLPRWSPDGRHIAFIAGAVGSYVLWVVDPDRSADHLVPTYDDQAAPNDLWPSWSPDGTTILYLKGDFPDCCTATGRIVTPGTQGDVPVGPPLGFGAPVWSPQGDRIIGVLKATATQTNDRVVVLDPSLKVSAVILSASDVGFLDWQPVRGDH